ncbi:response regulator [Ideonella sp. DXS29W]|uniref:Response regulator n=1 Tax=Ideonella lacteola TaxID=2984193 RepID=A0ABU9BUB9_9BURK
MDVLVVDDNPDSAELMAMLLSIDGYVARFAIRSEEALALASESPPLCALIDVVMPGLSGHELASRLRDKFGDSVVLIAVSGLAPSDAGVSPEYAVFDHYLPKPISQEALRRLLPPL